MTDRTGSDSARLGGPRPAGGAPGLPGTAVPATIRSEPKEEANMRKARTMGWSTMLIAGLAILSPAAPAAAQEPPAQPDEATRDAARQHFRAGRDAFNAANYEEALTEFRQANELIPAGGALSYVGQCLIKLNRQIEALRTFRQYVQLYPNATTDRDRTALQEVKDWIDQLEDVVGEVQVDVAVSGATVLVDGQVVGPAPLAEPVEVVQGPHTFRAEAEGFRPAEETVTVASGQRSTVTLVPAPLQTTANVNLSANVPGATAVLDGRPLGTLPFGGEIEPGVHQLEVAADGYDTVRLAITLEAGQPFSRSVELMPTAEAEEAWYEKWWVWTIAGVVVAGATTGIVLGTTGGATIPDSSWRIDLN
jgi:tetratricopeptide (TPR) repeat protein